MDDPMQHGSAGRRDDRQDDGAQAPNLTGGRTAGGETDGAMGGMHDGAQRAADGAPQGTGETGRVGESPRQGQGGYGNDTGFVGGTSGATGEFADAPRADEGGQGAQRGTADDDATRRASSAGSQGMRDDA